MWILLDIEEINKSVRADNQPSNQIHFADNWEHIPYLLDIWVLVVARLAVARLAVARLAVVVMLHILDH
jgi:hypothetical protein